MPVEAPTPQPIEKPEAYESHEQQLDQAWQQNLSDEERYEYRDLVRKYTGPNDDKEINEKRLADLTRLDELRAKLGMVTHSAQEYQEAVKGRQEARQNLIDNWNNRTWPRKFVDLWLTKSNPAKEKEKPAPLPAKKDKKR